MRAIWTFRFRARCRSEEREALQPVCVRLKPTGIPDTVAYLTEEELGLASKDLEDIGYDPQSFHDRIDRTTRSCGLLSRLDPLSLTRLGQTINTYN